MQKKQRCKLVRFWRIFNKKSPVEKSTGLIIKKLIRLFVQQQIQMNGNIIACGLAVRAHFMGLLDNGLARFFINSGQIGVQGNLQEKSFLLLIECHYCSNIEIS